MMMADQTRVGLSTSLPELRWSQIFRVWRRFWWVIVLAALTGAVAAYALSFTVTRVYEAEAVLLFDRIPTAKLENAADLVLPDAQQRAAIVHSQLAVLRSSEIVAPVIKRMHLADSTFLNPSPGLREELVSALKETFVKLTGLQNFATVPHEMKDTDLIASYLDHLIVRQDEDTYVLHIGVRAPDPDLAANIANAHVESYLAWLKNRRTKAVDGSAEWLVKELATARSRLLAAESAIRTFNERGVLLDADGHTVLDHGLAQLTSDLATAQVNLVKNQARANQIIKLQNAGQIAGIVATSGSRVLADLQAAYAQASTETAGLENSFGNNNPALRRSGARKAELKSALQVAIQNLVQGEISQTEIDRATVANLTVAFDKMKQQVLAAESDRTQLARLAGEALTERNIYLSLLTKLRSFDQVNELIEPDGTKLSPAVAPRVPNVPQRSLFTIFGSIVSGSLSGMALIWRMNRRDVVRNTSDTMIFAGARCLAVMPVFDRTWRGGPIDRTQPNYYFFLEELRSLCATVMPGGIRQDNVGTSVLITSSLPGEGKTTFCYELGRYAAQNRVSVLIVSTDPSSMGDTWVDPAQPTRLENELPLYGVKWMLPSVLLGEREIRRTVEAWQAEFNLVIFDTPPLSAMVESVVLAPIADTTIILARVDRTPRSLLASVAAQIEKVAGGRLAGFVMTFVELGAQNGVLPSDFGYYFDKNKRYHRPMISPQPGLGSTSQYKRLNG